MHDRFTWDDGEAAAKHRENEARVLIRSIKVEIRTERFSLDAPMFVHDPALSRQQGYISSGALRNDEDLARDAVIAEFKRASSALQRAKAVAMILGLSDEIDGLQGQIITLTERASAEGQPEV